VIRAVLATALLLATAAPAAAQAPLDDAGYLGVMDRMSQRLDATWDTGRGYYNPPEGTETAVNAELLFTHALAALRGHAGPARQDERARAIVDFLTTGPVWVEEVPPGITSQPHAPAWVANPRRTAQHLVHDVPAAEGLAAAWRARAPLGLTDVQAERIRDRIGRVARSAFYRYPALRGNQFNWYVQMLAADAVVNGRANELGEALRRHMARFVRNVSPRGGGIGNLGPGLRFHYAPDAPLRGRLNVDSAEYANIVLGALRFYSPARELGMPRASGRVRGLFGGWIRRTIAGYWTHAGYLNWDTGYGFRRWHQTIKVPLAQQGLIGIATSPELLPAPEYAAWAKFMLDRGLELLERTAQREGRLPLTFFGVEAAYPHQAKGVSRVAGVAARALDHGLGHLPSAQPPSLYSYDPDTGRLAVTTAAYNTAIVPVNQDAFPYGGIDLARLFDARQEVAATVGGRTPAAFGLRIRDARGRVLLATQRGGRRDLDQARSPLRLTRAPAGVGVAASTERRRAYAGPFERLAAVGTLRRNGIRATVRHRFTKYAVRTRWTVRRAQRAPVTVELLFPGWEGGAAPTATLRGGRTIELGRGARRLRGVEHLSVGGPHAGYRVTPGSRKLVARVIRTRPQPAAPGAGPALAIRLGRESRARTFAFDVRLNVEPR
jgi:hypothetical protein